MKKTTFTLIMLRLAIIFLLLPTEGINQTIRGTVVDKTTRQPLPFSTVHILDTHPPIGSISDESGQFAISQVQPGRYTIEASYVGYEKVLQREILVGTGKEVIVQFELEPQSSQLEGVTVRASSQNKAGALNSMAMISSMSFNVEETRRYAGGMDDPARLVTAFAGVSAAGNAQDNAIVIRGNSPRGVQWRVEGVEVPNPNHFSNANVVGGGFMSILSSQTLGRSDFFTGAFPAEYGNALAGVFDIKLRSGNTHKREYAFQAGILGLDFSAEGPWIEGGESSYLFNYRYSTMGLLSHANIIPNQAILYQDLSFKNEFHTKKSGTFTLWGLGGLDRTYTNALKDSLQWKNDDDRFDNHWRESFGATGIGHRISLGSSSFVSSSLVASGRRKELNMDLLDMNYNLQKDLDLFKSDSKLTLTSFINHRLNTKHVNRTGLTINSLFYNYDLNSTIEHVAETYTNMALESGQAFQIQAYTQSRYNLGSNWVVNAGLHGNYFALNNTWSVDPRIGLKWNFSHNQALSMAYGKHSQTEDLYVYLYRRQDAAGNWYQPNRTLGLTHAHHFVLGYDHNLSDILRLKVEPYYQYLYNVPGEENSSFSMINFTRDFGFNKELINSNLGRNMGVDITLERFLHKGYYYLANASVFRSEYMADDEVWRSTRYDKNLVINLLGGKELLIGNNMLGINLRANLSGGERRTPLQQTKSNQARRAIFDEENAWSIQDSFTTYLDASITYRINKKSYAGIWALQVKNVLGARQNDMYLYDYEKKEVVLDNRVIVVPSLSYKIEF
jgi:hypothetical protein